MKASEMKRGMFILYQGNIHQVFDTFHGTPGNLRAFIQLKSEDIHSGKIITTKWGVDDNVEQVYLDSHPVQFLYKDSEGLHFMEMTTYHSFFLSEERVGDDRHFLFENMELEAWFEGENPVKLHLPRHVTLTVTEAEPGIKGNSVSGTSKTVTLETGLRMQVPLFINTGDKIKIDTVEKVYLNRD